MLLIDSLKYYILCFESRMAEAHSMLKGIPLAIDLCILDVLIESDCLELVNLCKTENSNKTYFGNLVKEVQKECKNLRRWHVEHAKRKGDQVAHALAKLAASHEDMVWLEKVPFNIRQIFFLDILYIYSVSI